MPPCAASNRPMRSLLAPVNEFDAIVNVPGRGFAAVGEQRIVHVVMPPTATVCPVMVPAVTV